MLSMKTAIVPSAKKPNWLVDNMLDPVSQFLNNRKEEKAVPAREYKERIEYMLSNPTRYRFASETLMSIYDHIERTGCISKRQQEAIDNIEASV